MIIPEERWRNGKDIFIRLEVENVVFKWSGSNHLVYKKFRGKSEKIVHHSDRLFVDAQISGDEISKIEFLRY